MWQVMSGEIKVVGLYGPKNLPLTTLHVNKLWQNRGKNCGPNIHN